MKKGIECQSFLSLYSWPESFRQLAEALYILDMFDLSLQLASRKMRKCKLGWKSTMSFWLVLAIKSNSAQIRKILKLMLVEKSRTNVSSLTIELGVLTKSLVECLDQRVLPLNALRKQIWKLNQGMERWSTVLSRSDVLESSLVASLITKTHKSFVSPPSQIRHLGYHNCN